MYSFTYCEIMFFCMAILVLMLVKMNIGILRLRHQNELSLVLRLVLLSAAFEVLAEVLDKQSFYGAAVFSNVANSAYFVVTMVMTFAWMRYIGYLMALPFRNSLKKQVVLGIPMYIGVVFSVASIFVGPDAPITMIYAINEDLNLYVRGDLYGLFVVCNVFYMFLAAFFAARLAVNKCYFADRDLNWSLSCFGIFPFLATVLQVFFENIPTTTPGVTLALLFAFSTHQSRMISVDPLTHLNNRNQLNQFLTSKMNENKGDKRLYLFVLDMNKFKSINDTYGHIEGDNALILVAQVLKSVCGPRGHFFARFGGDEFNVVAYLNDDTEANELCEAIHSNLHKKSVGLPYSLTLSIGFADNLAGVDSIPEFFARADKKLYEQKLARDKQTEEPA